MKSIFTSPIRFLMIIVSAIALTACSKPTPDVEVVIDNHPYFPNVMIFTITSTVDEAVIKGVNINRGGCELQQKFIDKLDAGISLRFAQSWTAGTDACSRDAVKEMVVTTGKGIFTFTF